MSVDTRIPREQTHAQAQAQTVESRAVEPAESVRELREQMARLTTLVEQQQAKIEELSAKARAQAAGATPSRGRRRDTGRSASASRRALLKWGGAAAAAATVALVASEQQGAHASPANDGGPLLIGSANVGTGETSLAISGTSTVNTFFQVDASASANTNADTIAIAGVSNLANGIGVAGFSNGNNLSAGVYGNATFASVWGENDVGVFGVLGQSFNSTNGAGVISYTDGGYGVVADSKTGIDLYVGTTNGQGRMFQRLQATVWPPSTGSYLEGEQVRDANGELWLCVASGSPGTWSKVAHLVPGYSGGATVYLSKPIRLLDTRGSDPNALHNGGGQITAAGPYTLQVAGANWQSVQVPSNAVGAIGKVTVISTAAGSGFVAIVPSFSGAPTTGTLPYGVSQTVATSFNVGLGGSPGSIDIFVGGAAVDVVIDLFGVVA